MLTVTTFTFSITCTSNFEYRDYSKLNEKKILSNSFCKTFYEIVMQHENSLTQPLPPKFPHGSSLNTSDKRSLPSVMLESILDETPEENRDL